MTYFGFLALFVGIPIVLFGGYLWWRKQPLPASLRAYPAGLVVLAHILIAVVYTTPWDNYLVATRVWWYDPALVTGIVIGWVPIEEYSFFVLQTLMTGLWLLVLMRVLPEPAQSFRPNPSFVRRTTTIVATVWAIMLIVLLSGWQPGTYLGLELVWALIPIGIQVAFGADILRWRGRLVAWGIIPTTLYLSFADSLAIQSGTWTISPTQSLDWLLFGVLPIEEFVFFLITNTLVVFGCTLVLSMVSRERFELLVARWQRGTVRNA